MTNDLDQWLDEATPDEVTVRVPLNRRLVAEYRRISDELLETRAETSGQSTLDGGDDRMVELSEQLVAVQAEVDASARPFTFRCIEREQRRQLAADHPASDVQRKEQEAANRDLRPEDRVQVSAMVDPETYLPALMAASCSQPGMSVEQAVKLREFLPDEAWNELAGAVHQVNIEGTSIPKYERSIAAMLRSALNSTTPQTEASLSLSSEDGS